MTHVERSALVHHSPAQMFDVVNDVASYPRFLPWCSAAELVSETASEMVARLSIEKSGVRQAFTTRNALDRPRRIRIDLVEGPFTRLAGHWRFEAVGEGCKVSLSLEFDVDSRLGSFTLGKVFSAAADRMVDAFCDRADACYGG